MPVDGAGNFTRDYNWVADAANGLKIQAARMDGEFDNYEAALNITFWRDGRAAMTGDLKLGGFKVVDALLKFPAVTVPSADPNTLDDYAEGVFVPVLMFGGASVGITYGTQVGKYTKIGRNVSIEVQCILTSKGSSVGQAVISGLPFAPVIGSAPTAAWVDAMTGLAGVPVPLIVANQIAMYRTAAAGTIAMSNSEFTNTSDVRINATFSV